MNEFQLIEYFFKPILSKRPDVAIGIGDDAASVKIASGMELLVSTDTLVSGVHFFRDEDAFHVAFKAVMVNISDIAAMGGVPCWLTLSLTLPEINEHWLCRFKEGLAQALETFNLALIGGDTTRGPLSVSITILGQVPLGKAIRRDGAKPGDAIYVSGELGGAAQALRFLMDKTPLSQDEKVLMQKLQVPTPRVDLRMMLQQYATAAIDISDGLSSDLSHICQASHVGALLQASLVPIHPLVKKYQGTKALDFALNGGDDYELCFTVKAADRSLFQQELIEQGFCCFFVGCIDDKKTIRIKKEEGRIVPLTAAGYNHFSMPL